MQYNTLGKTGMKVSAVGFGTWLTQDNHEDAQMLTEMVKRARERGVNHFDTANEYGSGQAELLLGRALTGHERSSYVLSTKVCQPMGQWPTQQGLSRKHIFDAIDASLSRLKSDYVDVYYAHRADDETPLLETCRAFSDLVSSERIRYWATSWWSADQLQHAISICKAHGFHEPIACQEHYSALWRIPERDLLPQIGDLEVSMVAWSPLEMGVLTNKYSSRPPWDGSRAGTDVAEWMQLAPEQLEAVDRATRLAGDAETSHIGIALLWVLRQQSVASAIVGARSVEQLTATLDAYEEASSYLAEDWGEALSSVAVFEDKG